jgi:molecular chaperone DnaK
MLFASEPSAQYHSDSPPPGRPTEPTQDMSAKSSRQSRRHPRVPLSFLVQYRSDSFEDFLAEYATNISVSGMFVHTEDPREPGTLIYFQFLLADGQRLIEGLGKVVWSKPRVEGVPDPGMGVEFMSLDTDSVALIEEIIRMNAERGRIAADQPVS